MAKKQAPSANPAAQKETVTVQNATQPCANGHDWQAATYSSPERCSRCGETRGSALTPTPSPAPATDKKTGGIGIDELRDMIDSTVDMPKAKNILDTPRQMTVHTKNGILMYPLSGPGKGEKRSSVDEGTAVTVFAVENGYGLGITENNYSGWFNMKLLKDS